MVDGMLFHTHSPGSISEHRVLGNAQNVTNATCRSARAEKIRNRRSRAASARTAAVQCSAYLQLDLQKTMHLCFQENQRIQRLGCATAGKGGSKEKCWV